MVTLTRSETAVTELIDIVIHAQEHKIQQIAGLLATIAAEEGESAACRKYLWACETLQDMIRWKTEYRAYDTEAFIARANRMTEYLNGMMPYGR
jgi:hypothetical protein